MKTLLKFSAVLLLLTSATGAHAIGTDTLVHGGVSMAMGVGAGAILPADMPQHTLAATGLALVPGLAKEIYDAHQSENRFSWTDLAADALGSAGGAMLHRELMVRVDPSERALRLGWKRDF